MHEYEITESYVKMTIRFREIIMEQQTHLLVIKHKILD